MSALTVFEKHVAIDAPNIASPLLTHYTRQAIMDFCKDTDVWVRDFQETVVSADIVSTINDYYDIDLSDFLDYAARPIRIHELYVNNQLYETAYKEFLSGTNFTETQPTNIKFFSYPDNSTIRVYNIASSVLTMALRVSFKPSQTATSVPDFLFEDYLEPITACALFRLQRMPGKDWSNPEAASVNYQIYRRGISEAKRELLKGHSRKGNSVKPRSFGYHLGG